MRSEPENAELERAVVAAARAIIDQGITLAHGIDTIVCVAVKAALDALDDGKVSC